MQNSFKRLQNSFKWLQNSFKRIQNSFKRMQNSFKFGCKPVGVVLLDVDWDAVDEGVGTVLAHKLQCLLVLQQVAVVALQYLFPVTQPGVFFQTLSCRFFHDWNGKPLPRRGNPLLYSICTCNKILKSTLINVQNRSFIASVYTVLYSVQCCKSTSCYCWSGSGYYPKTRSK